MKKERWSETMGYLTFAYIVAFGYIVFTGISLFVEWIAKQIKK